MSEDALHAVAASAAIARGQVIAVNCAGRDHAVWRDADGALHAHPDRCPHRGMPLSLGVVRGDRLHCAYHGWAFDGSGACRAIPAQADLEPPRGVALSTRAVQERDGVVWLDVDAEAPGSSHEPPAVRGKTDDPMALGEWIVVGRSTDLTAGRPWPARLLGQDIVCLRGADGLLQAHEVDARDQPGAALSACERFGHLWVSFSASPRPMAVVPEFDEPQRRLVCWGGLDVHTSAQRLIENFLDMGHFAFVHPGVLGELPHTAIADYRVELRRDVAEVWCTGCSAWQPQASKAAQGGREVEYVYRTSGPFIAMLYKTAEQPGTFDIITMWVQPMDEDRCRVHGALLLLEQETPQDELIRFQHALFAQDVQIVERQTPRRLPIHDGSEMPSRADAGSVAYRRWLREVGMRFGIVASV